MKCDVLNLLGIRSYGLSCQPSILMLFFSAQANGDSPADWMTVALMLSKKGTFNPIADRPMHLLRCIPPEDIVKIWQNTDRNPRPDAVASAAAGSV